MISLLKEKQASIKAKLLPSQLSYLHSKSIDNFLASFEYLRPGGIKNQVLEYLVEYYREIELKEYDLSLDESDEIYDKYVMRIGIYYNAELNFRGYMKPKWALFIGVNIDLVLLVLGLLRKIYYLPVTTIMIVGWFLYLKFCCTNEPDIEISLRSSAAVRIVLAPFTVCTNGANPRPWEST